MLYWSLFSGRRRAIFPQTSDTLEGRVQFRAFLRQQIQGPGRYEPDLDFSNPGWLSFHLIAELRGGLTADLQVLQEVPVRLLRIVEFERRSPKVMKNIFYSLFGPRMVLAYFCIDWSWLCNAKWLHMLNNAYMCKTFSAPSILVKAMGHSPHRGISGIIYLHILESSAVRLFI